MPNINFIRRMNAPVVSGPSLDADTTAWVNAVVGAGGSVSAGRQTVVNTLITSLKAHSLWTVHDRIWLLAAENTQSALIDIKNLSTATNSGATFTTDQGYAGNASSQYIDTNFAPNAGVNFTQNSASVSCYVRTNRTSGQDKSAVGVYDDLSTGYTSRFEPYSNGDVIVCPLNTGGANSFDQFSNAAGTARGFYTVSRTGSTTTDVYRNSSASSLATRTAASATLISSSFYIGASRLTSAVAHRYSDDQIAVVAFGAGLSGANAAQFQTDINAYMTSIGTNVY